MGFELPTLVVIDTDCIGSCKSNYHPITTTMAPPSKKGKFTTRMRKEKITCISFSYVYLESEQLRNLENLMDWIGLWCLTSLLMILQLYCEYP